MIETVEFDNEKKLKATPEIKHFNIEPDHLCRYVKVLAKNQNHCPDWHSSAGGKAWLFVDEIVIE
ncbi:MAG: hypothetical protein ABFS35_16025 [Bacteroidota bacterium]